jgi:uncharacterized cupredoxin-like copper-binding protein
MRLRLEAVMHRRFVVLLILVVLGIASVGAVTAYAFTGGSATVKVAMKEWGIVPAPPRVKAGKLTFSIKNTGHLNHEFLVLKTNTAANKLKVKGTTAVVSGLVGKISQFKPGLTKTITLTLKPGHYVLICNLPAHYKAGQHVDFTVG